MASLYSIKMEPKLLGDEIGRGGFGIVYAHHEDKSLCVKVSNKEKNTMSCRQWSNEYKKIESVMKMIGNMKEYKGLKMVRVLAAKEFKETSSSCYMVMPRIYRPTGGGGSDAGVTIQAQCGWPSGRMVHKGRGEYIGVHEILEVVSKEDFELACYELGIVMGLIHFHGRNDAYDVELFLGREFGGRKARFYIADFDLSERVGDLEDPTVLDRLTWSFDAVPYFPRASCDKAMFQRFKEGYLKMALNAGVGAHVVEQIFEEYD